MTRFAILSCLMVILSSCQTRHPGQEAAASNPLTRRSFSATTSSGSAFAPALQRVNQRLLKGSERSAANELVLLENGQNALLSRLHLFAHAQRSIDYQTFIWANDETGQLLASALIAAAKRGVRVRILIDYMGLAKDSEALSTLAHAHPNLEVRVYRPTSRTLERGMLGSIAYALTNFKGANQRMHHKVVVIDESIGITGGRNVENSYFNHAASMNFKDRDALVVGPVAQEMKAVVDAFWNYRHTLPATALSDVVRAKTVAHPQTLASQTSEKLLALHRRALGISDTRRLVASRLRPAASVQFISDLPGKNDDILLGGGGEATTHIIRALDEAQRGVWVQSPYLVLGRKGRRFFADFRKRHPDTVIHISTNSFGSTDNLLAYAGNVRLRDRYVSEFGFLIQEYRPWPSDLRQVLPTFDWLDSKAMTAETRRPFLCLHAKSFVVDDHLAFVGSFNLDPRSAHLNTECGLIVRDRKIAESLKRTLQRDMAPANSWTIARRSILHELIDAQMLAREFTDMSPLDVSLLDATSAFELQTGREPVSRDDPRFYERYRDIGSFPGSPGLLTDRELKIRLLKFSTPVLEPLL